MSDWAVGDLAVCVDDGPNPSDGEPCPLKLGRIYRVVKVVLSRSGHVGLCLDGVAFPTTNMNAIYEGCMPA
jgi:hypothetical protein